MRKKILFILMVLQTCFIVGCATNSNNKTNRHISLDQEEEKLLCDIFVDEERIKNGILLDYQIDCLEEIRFAKQYLEEKYAKEFEIINYDPISKLNSTGNMDFKTSDQSDEIFHLRINENDDGYYAVDNYYKVVIEEKYDDELKNIVENELEIDCKTYTVFYSLKGPEVDGTQSVEEIIALGDELDRETWFFFNQADLNDDLEQRLKGLMKENHLYGSYTVCYAKNLIENNKSGLEIRNEIADTLQKDVNMFTFTCFD